MKYIIDIKPTGEKIELYDDSGLKNDGTPNTDTRKTALEKMRETFKKLLTEYKKEDIVITQVTPNYKVGFVSVIQLTNL